MAGGGEARARQWQNIDLQAGKCGVQPISADARYSASPKVITALDELSREVYCILGLPIDAIEIPAVLHKITGAAAARIPFVISTPNLNFLVTSLKDDEFRDSLLLSDLCPADGMPIVWIARLMGIPIKDRTAGSDVFAALRAEPRREQPLKIFLFGTNESTATAAARILNAGTTAIHCVGWICPGFGTVEELSQDQHIDQINSSGADFLVAALGAKKGQLWLLRNHDRLRVPVRAQLGATINYQVGTVKRAPLTLQKLGFEWLWRVWQEPQLWKRYRDDGIVFLRLLATHVIPLALKARSLRRKARRIPLDLVIELGSDARRHHFASARLCDSQQHRTGCRSIQAGPEPDQDDRDRSLRDQRTRCTVSGTDPDGAKEPQDSRRYRSEILRRQRKNGNNLSPQRTRISAPREPGFARSRPQPGRAAGVRYRTG